VGGEELSDNERDEQLQLCRQRLDAFRTPFIGSIKYRVRSRAHAAPGCGQTRPLG
jgi:hypothetical protein